MTSAMFPSQSEDPASLCIVCVDLGSPLTRWASRAKCRGTWKHPRNRQAQRKLKGPWLPHGCEFLCPCLEKSNTKLYSHLIFYSSTFTSPARMHLFFFKQEPSHWSQQDSAGALRKACICLDQVDIYRRLLLNWLLIIHLCQRVDSETLCDLFPCEKDGERLQR